MVSTVPLLLTEATAHLVEPMKTFIKRVEAPKFEPIMLKLPPPDAG
jgi:hypothetical protein